VVPLDAINLSSRKETRNLELDGPMLLGQVAAEEYDYFAFACPQTMNFRVFLKVLSGDADIFVSNTSPKPSIQESAWYSVERGDCEVQISHEQATQNGFGMLGQ